MSFDFYTYRKNYYKKNKERFKNYRKDYYKANKDIICEKQKIIYYRNHKPKFNTSTQELKYKVKYLTQSIFYLELLNEKDLKKNKKPFDIFYKEYGKTYYNENKNEILERQKKKEIY